MKTPHTIRGTVVHGNHLGSKLGFPTANLALAAETPFLLVPGVYAVTVNYNELVLKGMANAGTRPTVNGRNLTIEVHLFDFSDDLYGKELAVRFIERIRDERKFDSLEQLVEQLELDKKAAADLLSGFL